jgi:A/G-specific adenine glycosylase
MPAFSNGSSVKASPPKFRLHLTARLRFGKVVPRLLAWHKKNQRSFIWRGMKRTPYVVLVSEFMLQQTGTKQVEKKLPEFLKLFPTVKRLASASRSEVLRAWQGLGYNRRAINLHEAAKVLATIRQFPSTLEGLLDLPGVGLYTATAVLCFSKNEDTAVVDVNIQRVLSRLVKPLKHVHDVLPVKEIYQLDTEIYPRGKSSAWHEAVMDLGSTICTKNNPKCPVCPLLSLCPSSRTMKREVIQKESSEKNHFGQPRRIWRGRTLAAIMQSEPVTERSIIRSLRLKFNKDEKEFPDFVADIIKRLIEEGFVKRSRKGLCLA